MGKVGMIDLDSMKELLFLFDKNVLNYTGIFVTDDNFHKIREIGDDFKEYMRNEIMSLQGKEEKWEFIRVLSNICARLDQGLYEPYKKIIGTEVSHFLGKEKEDFKAFLEFFILGLMYDPELMAKEAGFDMKTLRETLRSIRSGSETFGGLELVFKDWRPCMMMDRDGNGEEEKI